MTRRRRPGPTFGRAAGRASGLALAALGVVGWLAVSAPPAAAHTLTGIQPTNYRSEVLYLTPPTAGITVRLLDLGRRIELGNRSQADVVVLGYSGEPYLRVGPTGVFENRRSPTLYKNRVVAQGVTTTIPASADPAAEPTWHRVSSGRTVRWRDHRTRWEGAEPVEVAHAPGNRRVLGQWTVALRQDQAQIFVVGRITWVPGPSSLPWVALAVVLAAGTVAASTRRRWGVSMAGAVLVLVAFDVVRAFGVAAVSATSLGSQVVQVLFGGLVVTAAWIAGLGSVRGLVGEDERWALIAGGVGLALGLASGVASLTWLARSQLPVALPPAVARSAVAVAIGLGSGLVGAAVVVTRRSERLQVPKKT